jgi:hypothetical protein
MKVATRGIAVIGQYHPFDVSPDLPDFPHGAQMISGVEEARDDSRANQFGSNQCGNNQWSGTARLAGSDRFTRNREIRGHHCRAW